MTHGSNLPNDSREDTLWPNDYVPVTWNCADITQRWCHQWDALSLTERRYGGTGNGCRYGIMRHTLYRSLVLGCSKMVTVPLVCTWTIGYGALYVGSSFELASSEGLMRTWSPTWKSCVLRLALARIRCLSICFCLRLASVRMFAISGMLRYMSHRNVSAPGDMLSNELCEAQCTAWCIALCSASCTMSLAFLTVLMGDRLLTMILITAAIARWTCSIIPLACGFRAEVGH
jgi:hypothetical protein